MLDRSTFKIAFTGNIGYAQGIQILPEAAALLRDEPVSFVIVGDGRYREKPLKEIEEAGIGGKFILIDRQPAENIPYLLAPCDAAFISFMDTELFTRTIPAKLQSYMACGMPIIAAAKGETERLIKEADCGVCVDIGNAGELAAAIRSLMKEASKDRNSGSVFGELKVRYGTNARRYFEEHFTRKKLLDEFEEYLQR